MSVKLYEVTDEGGGQMGFYVKGESGRKDILDAIKYEYPDFYDENILSLLSIDMIPCYVRIVPCHPNSENGEAGFSVMYYECAKGRGAMRATKFMLGLI